MNTCAVTIAGPDRRVDLVVSTETPISELIPTFVELSMDEAPAANGRTPVWTRGAARPAAAAARPHARPVRRRRRRRAGADRAALGRRWRRRSRPRSIARPEPHARGTPRERTLAALPEELLGSGERLSPRGQGVLRLRGGAADRRVARAARRRASARCSPSPSTARRASARGRAGARRDYEARLDRAIAAPRLTRCATIAIVSPKGGVGKTTLTVLLGSLLARVRRDRIVAVDTNPDFGSLGRTLTPDHQVFVDDLGDMLEQPDLSVTALDRHLGRAFEGLMVLPAPTDPSRMAQLNEESYRRVISRLQSMVGVLVLDCGTGLQEPAARAAQAAADQIVLISDAHPSTASLVAEAAELLRTVGPPLTLVVNKMPRKREHAARPRGARAARARRARASSRSTRTCGRRRAWRPATTRGTTRRRSGGARSASSPCRCRRTGPRWGSRPASPRPITSRVRLRSGLARSARARGARLGRRQ